MTSGSGVEVVLENPCHSVTSFFVWKSCGSGFLSGGLSFAALNYSHSIAPAEIIEWWTRFYPLLYGVEVTIRLVLSIIGVER